MKRAAKATVDLHCRTGSLEMHSQQEHRSTNLHCRTGSLEITFGQIIGLYLLHCRTGSLEKAGTMQMATGVVHCCTGSLEINVSPAPECSAFCSRPASAGHFTVF
tara:strand:- start:3792 stop:4106 length:315 start_codon:yes stop_codon:yes gene_type:complete